MTFTPHPRALASTVCRIGSGEMDERRSIGFTLIEVLVTLTIIGTLLAIAAPRYFGSVDRTREAVLRENLYLLRDSLDKYRADRGKYPEKLEELAQAGYLRAIPVDPLTDSALSWIVFPPREGELGLVGDVRSAAPNKAADGTWYKDW